MKQKLFTLIVVVFLAATASAQFSGSGSGTSSDPYLIFNPIQLDQVRNFLGQSNVYFKMMADIDLEEYIADNYPTQGWLPIGTPSAPFQGKFNGNGKKISNLVINRPSMSYVAFWGYVKGASITNTTISGTIIGGYCTSSVIGKDHASTISNLNVQSTIMGGSCVGGIIGCANSTIMTTCTVEATIHGTDSVGGLIGGGFISLSASSAIVDIQAQKYCGGAIGYAGRNNNSSRISTCSVSGNIRGTDYIGGIVGHLEGTSMQFCLAVQNTHFHGNIIGNGYNIGGVCGSSLYGNIIKNYSDATIVGASSVGGITGHETNSTLKQNVAINKSVKSNINNEAGRILGYKAYGTVGAIGTSETNKALNTTKAYAMSTELVCEDNEIHGQGVGKSVLKYKATYQGIDWDFANTWDMQETESYPYFTWQTAPPIINDVVSGATTVSGNGISGAVITLNVNGQTYQTTCSNNTWSITTEPLLAGSTIYAYAKVTDLSPSYRVSATVTYLGQGTETNPYQIYTAEELANINGSGYYKVMNDIDISSITPWQPLGQYEPVVNVDGDNHTISGLNINTTTDYQGLVAQCGNSTLKNIYLSVSDLQGGTYTGALVGYIINGNIVNCHVTGNITGGDYTGGLAGLAGSTSISECSVSGNVTGGRTASVVVGGLIGRNYGDVSKCYSSGSVVCTSASSIVGGLIGYSDSSGHVTNCYSTSDVTGSQISGGLIGRNYGGVEYCYAAGNITSTDISGGLVGYNYGRSATVSNCCAMNPSINATSSSGIAIRVIGGIANNAPVPDMNNYALKTMVVSVNGVTQRIYDDNLNGVAQTEAVLKQRNTYINMGWDMNDIWGIEEGIGYPYLLLFYTPPTLPNHLHLADGSPIYYAGTYEDGIDYKRIVDLSDAYAAFCLPFGVKSSENNDLEELYIPLGIALKYPDANNDEVLKVLFVPTDEVEAGVPFIAKLANGHDIELFVFASSNEISNVEIQPTIIIPYNYNASAVGSNAAVPTTGQITWNGTFENLSNHTFYALQPNGELTYQSNTDTNPFRGFLEVANMPNLRRVIAFVDNSPHTPTAIEDYFEAEQQKVSSPQKIIVDGHLYILMPDGRKFDASGRQIK